MYSHNNSLKHCVFFFFCAYKQYHYNFGNIMRWICTIVTFSNKKITAVSRREERVGLTGIFIVQNKVLLKSWTTPNKLQSSTYTKIGTEIHLTLRIRILLSRRIYFLFIFLRLYKIWPFSECKKLSKLITLPSSDDEHECYRMTHGIKKESIYYYLARVQVCYKLLKVMMVMMIISYQSNGSNGCSY